MAPAPPEAASQPYGHACSNCARSKCKCIPRPGGQSCQRCHRLDKPCVSGNATRSLHAQRNNPITRIAQLEGKLDGLVSLLGVGHLPPQNDRRPVAEALSPPTSDPGAAAPGVPSDAMARLLPDGQEADQCLADFRLRMLKYFPFLHLPANAQQLRQERPFLFLCIMAASAHSTQRKLALGDRIKHTLTQRVYLDNPGLLDIDLLLGLLTFIAWGHDHLLHSTPARVSRFTQLAVTIAFDLRLNKPIPDELSNMLPTGGLDPEAGVQREPTRSMEERRAVLACFFMSSIISSYFAKIDTMQWTPYMDDCLEVLSQNDASSDDQLFALHIRLQRIAGEVESIRSAATPAPDLYIQALQRKVDQATAQISPALQQDERALSSAYFARLSIFSIALSVPSSVGFPKLDFLCACLDTVRAALDNFFKIPPADYMGIPFPFFIHLARYIVVLYKLSALREPIWDTGLVRRNLDVLQVLDHLINNIQLAKDAYGEDANLANGPLERSAKIFVAVRSWCADRFSAEAAEGYSGNPPFEDLPLDDIWSELITFRPTTSTTEQSFRA